MQKVYSSSFDTRWNQEEACPQGIIHFCSDQGNSARMLNFVKAVLRVAEYADCVEVLMTVLSCTAKYCHIKGAVGRSQDLSKECVLPQKSPTAHSSGCTLSALSYSMTFVGLPTCWLKLRRAGVYLWRFPYDCFCCGYFLSQTSFAQGHQCLAEHGTL